MKKNLIILLLLLYSINLLGQNISVRKAMLYSAIVPGLGEIYTKDYNKAAVFLTVEAAIILSYFRLKAETNWATNSYKQFAYSITDIPKDREDSYYQLIQDFISSESYNEGIIRDARNYFLIYKNDPVGYEEYLEKYLIPEDMEWDWENNKNWFKYKDLRRDKQDFEIYTKFTLAAVILNRIVSAIDSAISAKKLNKESKYLGKLSFQPDWNKKGMIINYEYKF
jgi:hypothetical protein